MTPKCGEFVTILATLTVDDSSYVPVNTSYGVVEIKEDCVLEHATGFMFWRMWKSVCENVQTTKTYQLSHMVIKQYQGEIYLVLTLNTNVEEMQQQIEESKEKVHLNTENVFCSIKGIERYVSWSLRKRKISFTADIKASVKCTHCVAIGNISPLMTFVSVKMELHFDYGNWKIRCTALKDTFLNIIDFEKLNND